MIQTIKSKLKIKVKLTHKYYRGGQNLIGKFNEIVKLMTWDHCES